MEIQTGLTFDDVLLTPQYSTVKSRKDVDLRTKLTRNIILKIPLMSSNMDTVTEGKMAIQMALYGGIGIIHRYCSIDEQVKMVEQVKRAISYIIREPYTISEFYTIAEVKKEMKLRQTKSFLVVNSNKLQGIITNRDIKGRLDTESVKNCMTPLSELITSVCDVNDIAKEIDIDHAYSIMINNKIQKLPIVTNSGNIYGLICLKDIERIKDLQFNATVDKFGRLRCGAAVGINREDDNSNMDRVKALVTAGVDVVVIDIAHGHSEHCISTLKDIKNFYPDLDVIAGNIATPEGAYDLIKAGADAIKCSIGAGSICTTRIVSGHGVPQLSALLSVSPVCKNFNVPLISDGGNRNSGNIVKALAGGADSVMLGRMIAGSDESPGKILLKNGKRVKIIRGMASYEANMSNLLRQKQKIDDIDPIKFHSEGVEGYVPYSGPLVDSLNQLVGGIRSGLSYSGAFNIYELQKKAKFIRITTNGSVESGVHDITQT